MRFKAKKSAGAGKGQRRSSGQVNMPTPEQMASLPPYFQRIVKDMAMENPDVWKHLFSLALRRLGNFMTITPEELDQDSGFFGMGVKTDPPELHIFQTPGKDPEQVHAAMLEKRRQYGHDPMSNMLMDLRGSGLYNKKKAN